MYWREARVGVWEYPWLRKVLNECGLKTITTNICQRQAAVTEHIMCHPIFAEYREGEERHGSPCHSFWWEQELTLDKEPPSFRVLE